MPSAGFGGVYNTSIYLYNSDRRYISFGAERLKTSSRFLSHAASLIILIFRHNILIYIQIILFYLVDAYAKSPSPFLYIKENGIKDITKIIHEKGKLADFRLIKL